jgi:hypothetical protein
MTSLHTMEVNNALAHSAVLGGVDKLTFAKLISRCCLPASLQLLRLRHTVEMGPPGRLQQQCGRPLADALSALPACTRLSLDIVDDCSDVDTQALASVKLC